MAVPAFGFSAGDFIAAVSVLKKTFGALRDTGGASSQYQHAILQLKSTRLALLRLQSLEPISEDMSIVDEIRKVSKACIIPFEDFLATICKLDAGLRSRKRKLRKAYAQVKWVWSLEPKWRRLEQSLDEAIRPSKILLLLEARQRSHNSNMVTLETKKLAAKPSGEIEEFAGVFNQKASSLD